MNLSPRILIMILLLTSACMSAAPNSSPLTVQESPITVATPLMGTSVFQSVVPLPPSQPTQYPAIATETQRIKELAPINLSGNGKTFTFQLTTRFIVFLDDKEYPVKDIKCTPEGIIGYVSNGSVRGPDNYPIMFEAVGIGTCTLRNKDFQAYVTIIPRSFVTVTPK